MHLATKSDKIAMVCVKRECMRKNVIINLMFHIELITVFANYIDLLFQVCINFKFLKKDVQVRVETALACTAEKI